MLSAEELREKELRDKEKEKERLRGSGLFGSMAGLFGRKAASTEPTAGDDVPKDALDPDKPPPICT